MPYNRHNYEHRYHFVENQDPYYSPMSDWEKALGLLVGIGFAIVVFGSVVYTM